MFDTALGAIIMWIGKSGDCCGSQREEPIKEGNRGYSMKETLLLATLLVARLTVLHAAEASLDPQKSNATIPAKPNFVVVLIDDKYY